MGPLSPFRAPPQPRPAVAAQPLLPAIAARPPLTPLLHSRRHLGHLALALPPPRLVHALPPGRTASTDPRCCCWRGEWEAPNMSDQFQRLYVGDTKYVRSVVYLVPSSQSHSIPRRGGTTFCHHLQRY